MSQTDKKSQDMQLKLQSSLLPKLKKTKKQNKKNHCSDNIFHK